MIEVGTHNVEAPFVTAYSDVNTGSVLVRGPGGVASNPAMLAINMGNFSTTYEVKEGDPVKLTLLEKSEPTIEKTMLAMRSSPTFEE